MKYDLAPQPSLMSVSALDEHTPRVFGGLVKVCCYCSRIQDERGRWRPLEGILLHPSAELSHGLCPDCARELYPGLYSEEDA